MTHHVAASSPKKSYVQPLLREHGDLRILTQASSRGAKESSPGQGQSKKP